MKLLENQEYIMSIIPDADNSENPGQLIRLSQKFRKGRFQDQKSPYFLVELTAEAKKLSNGRESIDHDERGRIVFPVMKLTDRKRYDFIVKKLQQTMGEKAKIQEYTSKSPLVDVGVGAEGAYYKIYAPHTTPDGDEFDFVNFFVRRSDNNEVDAIQNSFDAIRDSMVEREYKFKKLSDIQPDVVEQAMAEGKSEAQAQAEPKKAEAQTEAKADDDPFN